MKTWRRPGGVMGPGVVKVVCARSPTTCDERAWRSLHDKQEEWEDDCAQIALSVIYLLFKFEAIPSTNEGVRVVHALHMPVEF